jgi:prophage antirepressor-like protein
MQLTKSPNQFTHEIFGSLTTILNESGDVYFIGKEVASLLGYSDTDYAIRTHCKSVMTYAEDSSGQVRHISIIPERDLYRLVIKSKKEEAEKFEEWVVGEVLPSIRKTGGYAIQPLSEIEVAKRYLEALIEKEELKNKIALDAPKVEYFDKLVDRDLLTNFRDTAKELGVKQNEFINFLLDRKYIYRDQKGNLKPSASHMDLFDLKEFVSPKGFASTQTFINPKGRATFLRLLEI